VAVGYGVRRLLKPPHARQRSAVPCAVLTRAVSSEDLPR